MNDFDIELIKRFVPAEQQDLAFSKLQKGYPVQYIIGNVDFYNCIINVNKDVLIPRFETEYLVDTLINLIKNNKFVYPSILDIGTGSGCISIALKKNIVCNITAIDKSAKAIKVAKQNAKINCVDIKYIVQNVESFTTREKFDIIVSNPPYVPINGNYDPKIKFEPFEAIFAPDDGLFFYKVILQKATLLLKPKSILAFEIGDKQGQIITELARKYFPKSDITLKKDLNGYDRYIFIINE